MGFDYWLYDVFMGIGADLQKRFKDEHCLFLFIAGEMTLAMWGLLLYLFFVSIRKF